MSPAFPATGMTTTTTCSTASRTSDAYIGRMPTRNYGSGACHSTSRTERATATLCRWKRPRRRSARNTLPGREPAGTVTVETADGEVSTPIPPALSGRAPLRPGLFLCADGNLEPYSQAALLGERRVLDSWPPEMASAERSLTADAAERRSTTQNSSVRLR